MCRQLSVHPRKNEHLVVHIFLLYNALLHCFDKNRPEAIRPVPEAKFPTVQQGAPWGLPARAGGPLGRYPVGAAVPSIGKTAAGLLIREINNLLLLPMLRLA